MAKGFRKKDGHLTARERQARLALHGSTGFEKELIRVIAAQLMPKEKAVKKEEAFSL